MSRLGLVVAGSVITVISGAAMATPAMADVTTSSNCTLVYAGALAADTLSNGPVHDYSGTIVVGDMSPGVFVAGGTSATSNYVTCLV